MAELIDYVEDELVNSKHGNFEEVTEQDNAEPEQPAEEQHQAASDDQLYVETEQQVEDDVVPDKYAGKTKSELAAMLENSQTQIGRQSNEIGEIRRSLDTLIETSVKQKYEEQAPEEVDYFTDPQSAVNRSIDSHPAVRQMEEQNRAMAIQNGKVQLQQKHPDMEKIITDPQFAEWVKQSEGRLRMYEQADQHMDVVMADELLSTYKALRGAQKSVGAAAKKTQRAAVQQAATGAARNNPDGNSSNKVYRRSEIRRLMNKDPEKFDRYEPDIMRAYAEGRVID